MSRVWVSSGGRPRGAGGALGPPAEATVEGRFTMV
jgi:hypothetical protein